MKITNILNQSKRARDFYFGHQDMEDGELLKNLEAIFEIEKKQKESKIVSKILDDYFDFFHLSPIDILEKIKNKNEREIRFGYEEFKTEINEYGKAHYKPQKDDRIKFSNNNGENHLKDSFSSHGRDLIR